MRKELGCKQRGRPLASVQEQAELTERTLHYLPSMNPPEVIVINDSDPDDYPQPDASKLIVPPVFQPLLISTPQALGIIWLHHRDPNLNPL
jgi:hypothetical protein